MATSSGNDGTECFSRAGFEWRVSLSRRALVEALCADLDDLGRIAGARRVKRSLAREVWRLPLTSGAVYLKRFRVRGVFEQLKYRVRPPRAQAEWRAAAALAERGIAAAAPIADYIAGMTDRYAIQEYQRLFDAGVRA